jgi:capsular polysaccharide transport system permease protein
MARSDTSLLEAARVHVRTVTALIVRDMMMRYGRDNIGFAWVVLEPMILTSGVMVIWSLTGLNHKAGLNLLELVLTGYLPLTLWRHLTNNFILLFRRTSALLYHRTITLFDIVFARAILEFLGATIALLAVWAILTGAGLIEPAQRLDLMLVGWLMMAWLGSASGALIAIVTELWEAGERIIQPIQYVIIPISGAFFMVDWVPYQGQQLLLLNPTVHCYELFRAGFWGDKVVTHYSVMYVGSAAFILTYFAFTALVWVRSRVQLT